MLLSINITRENAWTVLMLYSRASSPALLLGLATSKVPNSGSRMSTPRFHSFLGSKPRKPSLDIPLFVDSIILLVALMTSKFQNSLWCCGFSEKFEETQDPRGQGQQKCNAAISMTMSSTLKMHLFSVPSPPDSPAACSHTAQALRSLQGEWMSWSC